MGSYFSKEKNDPKTQVVNYYMAMKGETSIDISEEDKDFRTEAVRNKQYGWSLLHLAVWFMNEDMVRKLLKFGFDVNLADIVIAMKHDETPLHIAAYQGNEEIYSILVDSGADITMKNKEDKTPKDLMSGTN